jgi:hypothetical protein
MIYEAPELRTERRRVTRDEWWWIVGVVVFALRVYSNYQLEQAVEACERSGGVAKVTSSMFGSSWTVTCYR